MSDQIERLECVVKDCQAILTEYLTPDGPDADKTISYLLGILDGPQARDAMMRD